MFYTVQSDTLSYSDTTILLQCASYKTGFTVYVRNIDQCIIQEREKERERKREREREKIVINYSFFKICYLIFVDAFLRQASEMKTTEVINKQSDKDPVVQTKRTETTVSLLGKTGI